MSSVGTEGTHSLSDNIPEIQTKMSRDKCPAAITEFITTGIA
jgi:hypothetical protein